MDKRKILENTRRQLWRLRVTMWAKKGNGRRCIWKGRHATYLVGNTVIRVSTLSMWGR